MLVILTSSENIELNAQVQVESAGIVQGLLVLQDEWDEFIVPLEIFEVSSEALMFNQIHFEGNESFGMSVHTFKKKYYDYTSNSQKQSTTV